MINIIHQKIQHIPSLIVVDKERQQHPLPLIIYFHGFTSAKENNLPIAYLLAKSGYRVVLPDALHHGERESQLSGVEKQLVFWDIVFKNVAELHMIKQFFEDLGLIDKQKIGIAGTSMGGITTAAALTQYSWINVAAILMGTPKLSAYAQLLIESFKRANPDLLSDAEINSLFEELKSIDLSIHKEIMNERPLMFWHGNKDDVIPFTQSYQFYQELKASYSKKNHLHFIEEDRAHKVSRKGILETVSWFTHFL